MRFKEIFNDGNKCSSFLWLFYLSCKLIVEFLNYGNKKRNIVSILVF